MLKLNDNERRCSNQVLSSRQSPSEFSPSSICLHIQTQRGETSSLTSPVVLRFEWEMFYHRLMFEHLVLSRWLCLGTYENFKRWNLARRSMPRGGDLWGFITCLYFLYLLFASGVWMKRDQSASQLHGQPHTPAVNPLHWHGLCPLEAARPQ